MRRVWGMGDPAGGTRQFTGTALAGPDLDEVVVPVDAPDIATRIPQVHPGPLAAYAGGRPKRLVLTFSLPARPDRPHLFSLRAFALQGPVPDLEIGVNGRRGLYFPVVRREDRRGLPGVSAISGWIDLEIPVDPTWLLAGENRLTVTTMSADPLEPLGDPHPELPVFWGSAISYVALGLDELEEHEAAAEPAVDLTPLPLYVESFGGLAELVDVVVTSPSGFVEGALDVTIGAERRTAALGLDGRDFGQMRIRFAVPEQATPVPAHIVVRLDEALLRLQTTFRPCRKWTLHLLPHVHLDLGYTDFQAKVAELHTRNIDRVLDILASRPDYAYSVDGSYVVEQFLRTRSPAAATRLRSAVADGRISVNAFYALFLTGLATLEECFRAGVQAAGLRREHGIPIDYVNLTDVPSYSGALPTILGAMGVDTFLGIQNHGRAANADSDTLHLASPFRWQGPDGTEVLSFFSDCYAQLRYFAGYPVSVHGSAQSFSRFVSRFERDDYLPSDLPIVGIYSDNEDLADGEADFVARWEKSYAYPRVRFSTVTDYFAAVRPLAEHLPLVRGDGGSYWEDGVGAGAAIIADYRRTQTGLAAAETLATLVSGHDPALRPSLADLDPAWDGLLVGCEHTWTSMHAPAHPNAEQTVDQLAWKAHHVASALRVAVDETRRALSQLGERVTTNGPSLIVANSLGWDRDVEAEIELPPGTAVAEQTPGVTVEPLDPADDLPRVRMAVRGVPAFGYRVVPLETATSPAGAATAPDTGGDPLEIDGVRYRLRVTGGRVTSLWCKALDRELIDPERFGLGEVVYVRGGGEERTRLHDADLTLPEPALELVPARMGVSGVRRGPLGTTVTLRGAGPSLPVIEAEVRIRDNDDRVDLVVRLEKEAVQAKESVYVAFPFAVPDGTVRYDRQVGWVQPSRDHLPGACNDWFTTLFGVAVDNPDLAITWTSVDAPLFTLDDVVRGRWSTAVGPTRGTILSWIMNNHWWTNFPPSQEGRLELRYAFRPARTWDVTAATRFGREIRSDPATGVVGWMDKMDTQARALPGDGASLLDVRAPAHVLATVVAARRAPGCVVRLQEVAGLPAEAVVRHPRGQGAASLVDALEEDIAPLDVGSDGDVTVRVEPYGVTSVLLGWG